jgi:hypothetical protein
MLTDLPAVCEFDTPKEFIVDLDSWFLNYVATELPSYDQQTHSRHVAHYQELRRLIILGSEEATLLLLFLVNSPLS